MESRNFIFVEIPSHQLPQLTEESRVQACGHGLVGNNKNHSYIIDDDFFRDTRD